MGVPLLPTARAADNIVPSPPIAIKKSVFRKSSAFSIILIFSGKTSLVLSLILVVMNVSILF